METNKITWINCDEELPKFEDGEVILWDLHNYYVFYNYSLHISWLKKIVIERNHKWTLYTPEKWEELNKCPYC